MIVKIVNILVSFISSQMSKKAFLIGLNYYNTNYELKGCINDVINIEEKYKTLGFTEFVRRIERSGCEPTISETLKDLEKFITSSKPGDLLAFHYSGHGSWEMDKNGDEKDKRDEKICLLDGWVHDDVLYQIMVKNLPIGVKLRCLFDCCNSGTIIDLPYRYQESWAGYTIENVAVGSAGKDVIMISGCRDDQTSADAWIPENKKSEGAMTWAWLKTLQWMDKNMHKATWKDIVSKMRFTLVKSGYTQVPQLGTTMIKSLTSPVDFITLYPPLATTVVPPLELKKLPVKK